MLIPRRIFELWKICCDRPTRFAISGIRIERKGETAIAVATDGKRIIRSTWKDNPEEFPDIGIDTSPVDGFAATIPVGQCKTLQKMIPKKSRYAKPVISNLAIDEHGTNGTLQVGATDAENKSLASVSTITENYPDYQMVIDSFQTDTIGHKVRFSIPILRQTLEVLESICTAEDCTAEFIFPADASRPFQVRFLSEEEGTKTDAYVMPIVYEKGTK